MIWCVEDDESIRDIEVYALNSMGFVAKGFENGKEFFEALKVEKPKLIILDLMLPEISGVEILKKIRQSSATENIPVIVATAKGTEYDKVKLLDLGADDYLVKPFGMMEMVSRVKAVLRRSLPQKETETVLRFADKIVLKMKERSVKVDGKEVMLTYKEFELLALFLSQKGIVLTRERLYNDIWGSDYIGETRTVDMHIRTLRQKLGEYGNLIATVRNLGYRLEEKSD